MSQIHTGYTEQQERLLRKAKRQADKEAREWADPFPPCHATPPDGYHWPYDVPLLMVYGPHLEILLCITRKAPDRAPALYLQSNDRRLTSTPGRLSEGVRWHPTYPHDAKPRVPNNAEVQFANLVRVNTHAIHAEFRQSPVWYGDYSIAAEYRLTGEVAAVPWAYAVGPLGLSGAGQLHFPPGQDRAALRAALEAPTRADYRDLRASPRVIAAFEFDSEFWS